MYKILPAILTIFLMTSPAFAGTVITTLADSHIIEEKNMIRTRSGYVKEQVNKITVYTYITSDGEKIEKNYKIKKLVDSRTFEQKHPILIQGVTYAKNNLYFMISL